MLQDVHTCFDRDVSPFPTVQIKNVYQAYHNLQCVWASAVTIMRRFIFGRILVMIKEKKWSGEVPLIGPTIHGVGQIAIQI